MRIILASTSSFRAMILTNAGLSFEAKAADIDERGIEKPFIANGATPAVVADILAQAKAVHVSQAHPGALIIGGDQTLSIGDIQLHKPKDISEARHHLLSMSGKTHDLNSAIALAVNGKVLWKHISTAHMSMRHLSSEFIDNYLTSIGDTALSSVGAYQIEGRGVQLFERIDGDYFAIIGLPLLPLLEKLRELGAIDG